jgi:hypothetical protein
VKAAIAPGNQREAERELLAHLGPHPARAERPRDGRHEDHAADRLGESCDRSTPQTPMWKPTTSTIRQHGGEPRPRDRPRGVACVALVGAQHRERQPQELAAGDGEDPDRDQPGLRRLSQQRPRDRPGQRQHEERHRGRDDERDPQRPAITRSRPSAESSS